MPSRYMIGLVSSQTSGSRRHRELPKKSTKAGQHQDILQLNSQNIVIKKKKNLKSSKTKEVLNLKGKTHRASCKSLHRNLVRREWRNIFNMLNGKKL